MTDAVSIEQINRIRISLGQAPLPVPGQGPQFKDKGATDGDESDASNDLSTFDKRQAAADGNWRKLEAERLERVDRQKRKDAAKKARDAAQRFQKLEGKGLGEGGPEDELDTRAWLMQQKKRQKQIEKARKLEADLIAQEQQAEYDAKDLAGVKVGHSVDQFDEMAGEQILTLKDAGIGEESEDDELENADLKAKEKLEEKLRLKKKRPDYDPTEQDGQKNILSKYDEEIDGKQQKHFTLDGQGSSAQAVKNTQQHTTKDLGKGLIVNLDMLKDEAPASDYLDPSSIKIKKPKKNKKEKKSRQKNIEDDETPPLLATTDNATDIKAGSITNQTSKKRSLDLDDDDDLQAKLAEQRRSVLKKRKRQDAADVVRQMREEMAVDEEEPDQDGLTIDETSEFVANLRNPDLDEVKPRKFNARMPSSTKSPAPADNDGDQPMGEQSYANVEEANQKEDRQAINEPDTTATGLEDEATMLDHSVAGIFNVLRQRGLASSEDGGTAAEQERQRATFLGKRQELIQENERKARAQREEDRSSGHYDKMSTFEREENRRRQNEAREHANSKALNDLYIKNYKPNVQLRYENEFGLPMGPKEAFQHQSHGFHGRGPGKQKIEKRLKKIADEKKRAAKGTLNVGDEGGMMGVQGREGKRQNTAGVRMQ